MSFPHRFFLREWKRPPGMNGAHARRVGEISLFLYALFSEARAR